MSERGDEHENQIRKSCTGLVKLTISSNNFDMHSNPRISRIMFHEIAEIYRELKHQETLQVLLAIQNLKSP